MRKLESATIVMLTFAVIGWGGIALADTTDAMCEVRKDGDTKQGASGPCTFSQRHGYVSIDLRNGDRVELSPTDKPNRFKDQNGKTVVLTVKKDANANEYKWDHKKLIVRWNAGSGASSGSGHGDTPHALRDLVGARASTGEDALRQRGYSYRNGSTSGSAKYSNWRENSTGRCITVRTENGRYASIVHVPEFDCQKSESGHGGGGHGGADWKSIGCTFAGNRETCKLHTEFSQAGTGVQVKFPDGFVRKFVYDNGRFRSNDGMQWKSRLNAGLYYVSNDNKEEFEIPADWLR